jgi:hypothetical protein
MVDDQVHKQIYILPQFLDIFPTSQARIDPGMIDRIKAGIDAVNGIIEWQDVNAAEQTGERAFQQLMQCINIASSQAICISDELYGVFHVLVLCVGVLLIAGKIPVHDRAFQLVLPA